MQLFQPQLGDSWNAGESYSFPYRSKGPAHCPGTKEGHACCARRLECKSGQGCLWKLAFSPLLLSALSSSHFHCALQKFFCLFWARPDEQRDVHTTSLCVFLRWSGRSYHAYHQKLPRIIYLLLEILPCRFIPLHFPQIFVHK